MSKDERSQIASAGAVDASQDGRTGSHAGAPDTGTIGQRFHERWAEELLDAAFASAGHASDAPRSIGVLEVARQDGGPIAALLDDLGPDLTLRIRRNLPRGARLVFAHGARFVMALPGDPLLEALLIVDRVRDALERETWCVEGEPVGLVFEAGVSTRHGEGESLATTLEAAERSLVQAHGLAVRRHGVSPEPESAREAAPRPIAAGWPRAFHTDT